MKMLMSLLLVLFAAAEASGGTVSGSVMGLESGAPPARVFLEPGIEGTLMETRAAADGSFRFENVPAGIAGVFAVADGMSYGGCSVTVGAGDSAEGIVLAIKPARSVSGTVCDAKGKPVAGAEISRVALLGAAKVSIPLDKLRAFGGELPASGPDGAFTVARLPEGGAVALKIVHPLFAQEAVTDLPVGTQDVRITLHAGVSVSGKVHSRDLGAAVANATVIIQNAQPPHDSVLTRTDAMGAFATRLKPGVYLCQALSAEMRSPGWQQLILKGETAEQRISLFVGHAGALHGLVCEAASGKPLEGAHITVTCLGNTAATVTTGPSGAYAVNTVAGENVIRLQAPAGYLPPENSAIKLVVDKGADIEAPTFWLSRTPTYTVQIVDAAMQPARDVVVSLIRPAQFGWRLADAQGCVAINVAQVPPDGLLVGMAEHISRPEGALFAVHARQAEAKVQLFPLASIQGTVLDDASKPLAGAPVGAVFADDQKSSEVLFWRTVSRNDGSFVWDSVAPQVPQRCIAMAGTACATSQPFAADIGAHASAGSIILTGATGGTSLIGKPLVWDESPLLAGTLPDKADRAGKPAVVMYCSQDDAAMVVEALAVLRTVLGPDAIMVAAVVHGAFSGSAEGAPVLSGRAPGVATTYILDRAGIVTLETFGMPPLRALQAMRTH